MVRSSAIAARLRRCSVLALFAALALCASPAAAQITLYSDSTTSAELVGALQFRFSALHDARTDTDRTGFGIRRARLQYLMDIGERVGVFVQLEGQGPTFFDVRVSYDLTPRLRLAAGRFFGAQPAAFALTPFFQLDAIDRPFISRAWAGRTIGGDGRDFGVEALYRTDALEASLFLGNGDGSWDRLQGNLREDIGPGPLTGDVDGQGMALSGALAWRPPAVRGLDVGGFLSYNGSQNPNTAVTDGGPGRNYVSGAAHAYWGRRPGSQPVRLKADAIVVDYDENATAPSERMGGVSLLGAVRPASGAEIFARAERYATTLGPDDGATLVTAGASLSVSSLLGNPYEDVRFVGAWVQRLAGDAEAGAEASGDPRATGVIVQAQLMF